jgi:aryl-alcohol dehydrogenase-like predicted oxidoreductase
VETRRLGSTGLDVPVIGLGTWQTYDVGDATQVRPVTEAALADDATFFDTSPIRASR